jgi:tubulin polyglutamylase TTLL6/13
MADDVNEQVFNEKQLYRGDVRGEDETGGRQIVSFDLPAAVPSSSSHATAEDISSASKAAKGAVVSASERRRKRASARATQIVYWLETKYDVLYEVCASFENWKEAPSATCDIDLIWSDQSIAADRFMKLKPYQKINHFVGMSAITRKNNMGRNLLRMRKQFPTEYRFFPDTWILPTDLSDFKLQFTPAKNKTYIIKPDNGCQGKGIFLIRDGDKVPVDFSTTYVAQRYIHRPFLLDGHKFDLRLYVLVMGCDPLRIFLHRRGLVRLASEQYVEPTSKNLATTTIHLTNYAINKTNPNFEENTDPDDAKDGHKRSWEAVADHLRALGLDVDTMMQDIEDLIIKTLIAVQPSLSHFYHSCQPDDVENSMAFEILGFDVMLDYKLQPWLLEVNHAPSFGTESELDKIVKEEVLRDTFMLLNLSPETRRRHKREAREKMEQRAMGNAKKQTWEERSQEEHAIAKERTEWEDANLNGYTRLYPSEEKEREYMQYHDAAVNIWEMLMGGNSRRSVRLTQNEAQEEIDEKKASDKVRKGDGESKVGPDQEKEKPKVERRSADEIREAVERLSAGCSARPREKNRRRGSRSDFGAVQSDGHNALGNEDDGASGQGDAIEDGKARHGEPEARVQSRPEVQVGDVVKVQTNLGWESVVVKAKRTSGKIDIQFKDGEYMRSVLPRILREPAPHADQHGGDTAQQSGPKTARNGGIAKDGGSSSASAAASKVPPLPPPIPVDYTRSPAAPTVASALPLAERATAAQQAQAASYESLGCANTISGGPSIGALGTATGVIASAVANAMAQVNGDIGAVMASSSEGMDPKTDEAISNLNSMTSLASDRNILSQLRNHRQRGTNAISGGAASDSPVSLSSLQQVQPLANAGRGLRISQTTAGINSWAANPEVNKVREVRLRQQLQQLISVRPIVTRRKPQGIVSTDSDGAKSPRNASRRHTYGTHHR